MTWPAELSPYESSESDSSSYESTTFTKTVHPRFQRRRKAKPGIAQERAAPSKENLEAELAGLTEQQMLEKLREREQRRREQARPPKFLTEEEKRMTMDELHCHWKVERQRRRNEREDLRAYDFQPLGDLTEEQKQLPRREVERIVARRREEVWANSMRARGVELFKCSTCYRLHTGDHTCIATRWRTEGQRNSAVPKGVVVTGTPQGVRITTTPIIEEERLIKQLHTIQEMLDGIAAKKRLANSETTDGKSAPGDKAEQMADVDGAGADAAAQCV